MKAQIAKQYLDSDSLGFLEARYLEGGIEVIAEFFALKVSNPDEGEAYYRVTSAPCKRRLPAASPHVPAAAVPASPKM